MRDQFLQLTNFLKEYQTIWENEILHLYPYALDAYPKDWIDEIAQIRDPNHILKLEKKEPVGIIKNPELLAFFKRASELEFIPFYSVSQKLKSRWCTFHHMIPKKQHEIEILIPYIEDFCTKNNIKKIVDIGGGVGLLAQTLAQEYSYEVHSCDLNGDFQEAGKKRQTDIAPTQDHYVNFHQLFIHEDEEKFLNLLNSSTLSTGLHTCGNLANDQIKSAIKTQSALINMGCCYHKLKHHEYNLSQFAKTNGLNNLSRFALTLTSRGHKKVSHSDLELKQKVKYYRYAFHMFLYDHCGHRHYATLGNSHPSLYDADFATYATEQFKRLELKNDWGIEFLNSYFPSRKKLIDEMLAAGIIRDALGRSLEVYLLLDRALFLQEQGQNVSLHALFDESISPRNLCLTASPSECR